MPIGNPSLPQPLGALWQHRIFGERVIRSALPVQFDRVRNAASFSNRRRTEQETLNDEVLANTLPDSSLESASASTKRYSFPALPIK